MNNYRREQKNEFIKKILNIMLVLFCALTAYNMNNSVFLTPRFTANLLLFLFSITLLIKLNFQKNLKTWIKKFTIRNPEPNNMINENIRNYVSYCVNDYFTNQDPNDPNNPNTSKNIGQDLIFTENGEDIYKNKPINYSNSQQRYNDSNFLNRTNQNYQMNRNQFNIETQSNHNLTQDYNLFSNINKPFFPDLSRPNILNNNIMDNRNQYEQMRSSKNRFCEPDYRNYTNMNDNFSGNNINGQEKSMFVESQNILTKEEQILESLNLEYGKGLEKLNQYDYDSNLNNYTNLPLEILRKMDYKKWINNFKIYLMSTLLSDFLQIHEDNLSTINGILSFSNIQLVPNIPEDNYFYPSDEYILNALSENNFLKHNQNRQFLIDNNTNYQFNQNQYTYNQQRIIKIFFGDTKKIKTICLKILKIIDGPVLKEMNFNLSHYIPFDSNTLMQTNLFRMNEIEKKTSPIYRRKNFDFSNILLRSSQNYKVCLLDACDLLFQRIILNELLFPSPFIQALSEDHSLLIIEYCLNRIRELKNNIVNYSCYSGGDFMGRKWSSYFPSDSQLLSYFICKLYESAFMNQMGKPKFLYVEPITPSKTEETKNKVYIWTKNNPDCAPHFYLINDNIDIPCAVDDNFFQAFVMLLYFHLTKQTQDNSFDKTENEIANIYSAVFN